MGANWRYGHAVKRFEAEARTCLSNCGLPITAKEIRAKNISARNRLTSSAIHIVLGVDHLNKEIKKGRIHQALERLFSVCAAYEEMAIYRYADAFDPKLPIMTDNYYKIVNEGKKSSLNRGEAIAAKALIRETSRMQYQEYVDRIAPEVVNATWQKIQGKAALKFQVSTRTIRKYAKNPLNK